MNGENKNLFTDELVGEFCSKSRRSQSGKSLHTDELAGTPRPQSNLTEIGHKLPEPRQGQFYRHKQTGHRYLIFVVNSENAGQLRNVEPSGQVHIYWCVDTLRMFARLTHHWENESKQFGLIDEMQDNDVYTVVWNNFEISLKKLPAEFEQED